VTALSALLVAAGCSDSPAAQGGGRAQAPPTSSDDRAPADWPIHRGDQALGGVAGGALPDAPLLLWTFQTGAAIASSPVVAEGRVFVGSDDGKVYAVDLERGSEIWSFATEDVVEAPPLHYRGSIYVGSGDFFLYALDAGTGALRWKRQTDDKILGSANWVEPAGGGPARIVVGSYDNKLHCIDAQSGEPLWVYETANYVNGTPAVVGERIIFGGCDGVVHVVSADGRGLARVTVGEDCHIAGSVAVAGGSVYFGHYGNRFVRIDLDTGRTLWTYPDERYPFFSSPALGDDRVVFGCRDKRLHCAAVDDGRPLWQVETRRKVDGSPVICGDKVVFGSADGTLYLVRLSDGGIVWTYDIGQSIFSSPAVAGGTILIGANDGRLYAFGSAPGAKEASTP
jgi:outer membrane protein assembly factor BamB